MNAAKKIKVLQVLDKLGISDSSIHGVSRLLSWWLPEFKNTDCEVVLVELRYPSKATGVFKKMGVEVLTLGRSKYDPRTLFDLISIIRKEGADILHCHGYGSTTFGRIAGLLTRTPVIVHEHMVDKNIPAHQVMVDKLLSPFTARAIAVAKAVKEFMHQKRGLANEKIEVIYNGLPMEYCKEYSESEKYSIRKSLNLKDSDLVVSIVGRLDPIKGHDVFLKAVSQLADPRFICLIVGDGDLMKSLKESAEKSHISDKIRFLGFRNDISNILSVTDILVISSHSEGCPLTLLEGMAAGKAIVATAVGGIPEMLDNNKTALLVERGNADVLANAIRRLLEDSELRNMLGVNANRACTDRFLISHTINKFVQLYNQVMIRTKQ